ncbi:MAG: hypothetical protein ABL921_32760, partial [Pirellula sp.]
MLVAVVTSLYSIQLGDQLRRISNAERLERISKTEALNQLWEAKLAQGDAIRMSNQTGQRYEALNAIEEARAMGDSIPFSSVQIDKMRDATIACLALPDIRHDGSWKGHVLPSCLWLDADLSHSILAYEEQNFVHVCRTSTGEKIARIPTQANNLKAVFSNDGRKLALMKNECHVYAIEEDDARLLYQTKARGVWGFTPDGSRILGTDGDGQLVLVNLDQNNDVKHLGSFLAKDEIAISPDSKRAALYDGKVVRVIQLNTGKTDFQFDRPLLGIRHFAWYPNSQYLAIGVSSFDGLIELWNVDEQVLWKTIPILLPEAAFRFSSTGERLVIYDLWNQNLTVWNVNRNRAEFSKSSLWPMHIKAEGDGGFRILNWQKDFRLVSLRVEVPSIYDTLPYPMSSNSLKYLDLSYSQDGRMLAVASPQGDVLIFDALNRNLLGRWYGGWIHVQFVGNRTLLTSNSEGLARWEIEPDNQIMGGHTIGPPVYVADSVANERFRSNKDQLVAVPTRKGVELHSLDGQRPMHVIGPTKDARQLSFSPDGKRLATGEWDSGEFCIWDVASGELVRRIPELGHCFVEYSPNGKWLASNANHVRIRDAETGELVTELPTDGTSVSGVCMAFSPDSKVIAVSDTDGRINFLDPSTGRKLFALTKPNLEQCIRLTFNPNGKQLAVLSKSSDLSLWNLDAMHDELQSRGLEFSDALGGAMDEKEADDLAPRITSLRVRLDQRFLEIDAANQAIVLRESIEKSDIHAARIAISKIIKLQPRKSNTCNNLAWALATGPRTIRDTTTAVEFARRAMEDESLPANRKSTYLNTLGVVLYRDRQFQEAFE